jgi:hyperosmotically inducible protein
MKLVKSLSAVFLSAFIILTQTAWGANLQNISNQAKDAAITTKINADYTKDSELNPVKIQVTTENGHVTLKGEVQNDRQFEDAVMYAAATEGVQSINADHLTVTRSKAPMRDSYITAKVKATLLKNRIFGDNAVRNWTVNVTTKNRVVYLRGNVDSKLERKQIIHLAQQIDGVKKVKSSLRIKKNA